MGEYRKSSPSRFDIKMHIAWITKYRKKVLKGDIAYRVRDLIRRICEENEVEIIKGAISEDHVHLLVSMKPNLSVSKLVQRLKGKTSHKVQMEHESLRKAYWGRHFWARGYFCVSIGNVNEKMIKEYIEHHFEGEGSSDSFRIEGE